MFKALAALPRNVWLVGFVSLLNDSASEMIYPIVPLYLASVLMAGPRALGIIEGIAEATASLLKLFSGVIVDRTRNTKPWIVFGYALAGLGRPLIALTTTWLGVLTIRFLDRVGKGLRSSPRDALLAASIRADQRGLAFGLHRAMDNAGAVVGPLAATALLAGDVALQTIFYLAAIPGLLCLGLTLSIKEVDGPPPVRAPFDWRLGDVPPVFRRYLVVIALFTLGNSSNMFLLLRAQELGVAAEYVPLLWASVSAVAMLFSVPLSALSDKVGRVRLLCIGYIAYALTYIGMGMVTNNLLLLFSLFAIYGLFMGATEGVEKAFVADLVPAERRGTAFGWFNLTAGLFLFPASMIFGWLYQAFSPFTAFAFSSLCAFLAAFLLLTWVQKGYKKLA